MWEDVISLGSASKTKAGAYTYTHTVTGNESKYTTHTDYGGAAQNISQDTVLPKLDTANYTYKIVLIGKGTFRNNIKNEDIIVTTTNSREFIIDKIDSYTLSTTTVGDTLQATLLRAKKTDFWVEEGVLNFSNTGNGITFNGAYRYLLLYYADGRVDLEIKSIYFNMHNNGMRYNYVALYELNVGRTKKMPNRVEFFNQDDWEGFNGLKQFEGTIGVYYTFDNIQELVVNSKINIFSKVGYNTSAGNTLIEVSSNPSQQFIQVNLNKKPTLTLTSPNTNQTLYENSILQVTGTAHDTDADQSVTAYYQINNDAKKVLATNVSKMQIPLNKQLTFKSGKLFDGVTAVSGSLVDGVAHTLKVWAVDSEGAESVIETRTFYVVPNRAPRLEVTPPTIEGNIDSDTFTVSGTYADDDKNEVIISYRINGNVSKEVARGTDGAFDFMVSFAQLKNGNNTISVEAIDSYGAKTSRTIKLNKNTIATPLLQSTVRYLIQPPKGSAQAVLLWLQRDQELAVTASLHMGMKGEAEAFTLLEPTNTAPLRDNAAILEDEFYHEADGAKDHIILQLDMLRSSIESTAAIHLISGVFE